MSGGSGALSLLTKIRKLCSHPHLLDDETNFHTAVHNKQNDSLKLSGKMLALDGMLCAIRKSQPTDKCVVISNFTSALEIIQKWIVKARGWNFYRLDGSDKQCDRQSMVDSFNRGSAEQSFVFLLSSKAGGCGLNLIGANRLIMFDPDWNPATDLQAMARIYRQGQKKPCFIYRLFTTGTVEEVIYQRQTQKENLASIAVNHEISTSKKKFSKEELRDCFTLKDSSCDTKDKIGESWPPYNGIRSLESENCSDKPLLIIAGESNKNVLSYVHVCNEFDTVKRNYETTTDAAKYQHSNIVSSGSRADVTTEYTSEEEFEE